MVGIDIFGSGSLGGVVVVVILWGFGYWLRGGYRVFKREERKSGRFLLLRDFIFRGFLVYAGGVW